MIFRVDGAGGHSGFSPPITQFNWAPYVYLRDATNCTIMLRFHIDIIFTFVNNNAAKISLCGADQGHWRPYMEGVGQTHLSGWPTA
jgi:hypothetical protein